LENIGFKSEWYKNIYNIPLTKPECKKHYLNFGQFEGLNPNPLINTKYLFLNYLKIQKTKINLLDFIAETVMKSQDKSLSPHPLFDLDFYSKENSLSFRNVGQALYHFENIGVENGLYTSEIHQEFYEKGNYLLFDNDFIDMYFLFGNYLMSNDYSDKRFEIDSEMVYKLKSDSELYDFIVSIRLGSSTVNF
jgi:hypothetical protein